jgi:hypothetical protein
VFTIPHSWDKLADIKRFITKLPPMIKVEAYPRFFVAAYMLSAVLELHCFGNYFLRILPGLIILAS